MLLQKSYLEPKRLTIAAVAVVVVVGVVVVVVVVAVVVVAVVVVVARAGRMREECPGREACARLMREERSAVTSNAGAHAPRSRSRSKGVDTWIRGYVDTGSTPTERREAPWRACIAGPQGTC